MGLRFRGSCLPLLLHHILELEKKKKKKKRGKEREE
tara:strand:- start:368 stop:475 length:108 start_codon:yes stop_codon:yes gene_type:complete